MIKNDDKANLLDEKLMSIFDWNIPRKINFNSFVNNFSGNSFNDKYYNDKNCQNKISKFNPYDAEIDKKYKCKNEIRKVNNEINNDNNIIYFGFNSGEKNENKSIEGEFQIRKINNYINISSDEESNKITNNKFCTPKLNIRNNNEYTKLTQCSINNNNKKDMWYTDLKNGLNNMKIKSTNFSSNVSYESYDKNENKNFAKDRNKKVTFIHVNRNNKNEKSLIDNKNKENKINKLIQSRIHACKTLKTIDEYTETKKSKKNSHSRCKEKKNNLSCIKIHVNRTNKKDKEKSKSKSREKSKILNKMNLKKNNLNLRNEYKKKEKNNNDDKKGENIKERDENNNNIEDAAKKGKKKDSESIPKVKAHKSFFNSFLCCFECLNLDNKKNDINDNINKVPLTKLNTDINNKLKYKDKKSRNKSEKKKKK